VNDLDALPNGHVFAATEDGHLASIEPNGHFTGTYALSWDITHSTIVTQNVLATYMAQCCGLQMEFQKFHLVSGAPISSDRRFNVSFVLAGLGTFSNFFGAFGGNSLR